MISILTTFFGISLMIILPWIFCTTKRKSEPVSGGGPIPSQQPPKGGYKPGHLPEFEDPDKKETNTFYDVQSVIAFPNKDENGKTQPSTPQNIEQSPAGAAAANTPVITQQKTTPTTNAPPPR